MLLVGMSEPGLAQAKKSGKNSSASSPAGKPVAKPAPAPAPITAPLEPFILLPEPRAMRTERSQPLPAAKATVITAARQIAEAPGVRTYTADEFAKLGISLDTFVERARAAADRRLAALQPDYVRDEAGRLRYAVYRGDSPLLASLITAPSLNVIFQKIFGAEAWAVLPDRNSLYIFPARPEALAEFTVDLRDRFDSNPFAASPEIFLLKAGEPWPRSIGTFAD